MPIVLAAGLVAVFGFVGGALLVARGRRGAGPAA
jgi:hypothetical protein